MKEIYLSDSSIWILFSYNEFWEVLIDESFSTRRSKSSIFDEALFAKATFSCSNACFKLDTIVSCSSAFVFKV